MSARAPFPLTLKALFKSAFITAPALLAANAIFFIRRERFMAWEREAFLTLGAVRLQNWSANSTFFLLQNICISLCLLLCILTIAGLSAFGKASRIKKLIDAAQNFEYGGFNSEAADFKKLKNLKKWNLAYLERIFAQLGAGLNLLAQFSNKNAASLAQIDVAPKLPEECEAAVALIKICNYNNICKTTGTQTANAIVNKFLLRVFYCTARTKGTVTKICPAGNGFLIQAVWSGNQKIEKNVLSALRSCVLIRAAAKALNRDAGILAVRKGELIYPRLEIACGIDFGSAFFAPLGFSHFKELCVLGAPCQNAFLAASAAEKRGEEILLTEKIKNLSEGFFITRDTHKGSRYIALERPVVGALI